LHGSREVARAFAALRRGQAGVERQRAAGKPGTLNEFFKGRSTRFRLERKGDKVTASYSHDGKE
jgi:hypothetical protein